MRGLTCYIVTHSTKCLNVPPIIIFLHAKMRFLLLLSVGILAPLTSFAAPASTLFFSNLIKGLDTHDEGLNRRDNLCSLKAPPVLCSPNSSVTVDETAQRAYKFYRAFIVDGDPKTMFSLIDSTYKVRNPIISLIYLSHLQIHFAVGKSCWSLIELNVPQQHHPGYTDGPNTIWSLFCNGNKIGTEKNTAWCFDASTNMSYAQYSTTDRWRWVDGCVHEHVGSLDSFRLGRC